MEWRRKTGGWTSMEVRRGGDKTLRSQLIKRNMLSEIAANATPPPPPPSPFSLSRLLTQD